MSNPYHILFAAYQSDLGSNGGMESATRIFEALASDFRWTLLTNKENHRTERWRAGGASVLRFSLEEKDTGLVRLWRIARGTASALAAARQADILHGNDIRALQLLFPAARITRHPLVFTLRDTRPFAESYPWYWHGLTRQLDAMVTLSKDMARYVGGRLPVPEDRRYAINSIVDLDAFRPRPAAERSVLRSKFGIGPEELAVGVVAGLFEKKRQLEIIRYVMPQLADLPIRIHLIGDFSPITDRYSRLCQRAVEELRMTDRVIFHGFRSDAANWLAALDLVLIASRREGLARCMIEAMASGTAVISMDVSSAREMLEETGAGLVVGADDWDGLGGAIRLLAIDERKRRAMGAAGRTAAAARFSAESIAEHWRCLYRNVGARLPDEANSA